MRKGWVIAGAVAVMLLSGCSATAGDAETAPGARVMQEAPAETVAPEPSSEPTAAPIEMDSAPAADPATPWGEAGFESADAWYLASMEGTLNGTPPSDSALIGAASLACEQLRAGTPYADVRVVSGAGEDADLDNDNIVSSAAYIYCPDMLG